MPKRTKLFAAGSVAATLLVAVGLAGATVPAASAAVPPATPGNLTMLASAPRLVSSPGTAFTAGQTQTFQISGKTFGGTVAIPAAATGVVLSVTANAPAAAGGLTVWTTDAGRPGTSTVTYAKGVSATAIATVALNDTGKLNIFSTAATRVLVSIHGYVTPVAGPAPVVVKDIPAKDATVLDQVGGSIRGDKANNLKGATPFGSVVLTKGTWDARVIGGFTGLNNTTKDCTTGANFLTGTMVLVKGDGSTDPNRYFDFNQVAATAGGVIVPESDSATLTQDPTVQANTFITLTEDTKVTVSLFGYASNSSTDCTGTLKGNLQSAQFLKVA